MQFSELISNSVERENNFINNFDDLSIVFQWTSSFKRIMAGKKSNEEAIDEIIFMFKTVCDV